MGASETFGGTRRGIRPAAVGAAEASPERRDELAAARDAAADARDTLAERLDTVMGTGQLGVGGILERARDARLAAAQDRRAAAEDREHAARDRAEAAAELALEGLDNLTGTLRRGVGLAAVQRELARSVRDDKPLVLAFADVDGLKRVNDTEGHAGGDRLLRAVSLSIQEAMRSYDVLVRYGGDEFVCALAGDVDSVHARFEKVAQRLRETAGSSITVGLAAARPGESLEDLVARADAAMRAQRVRHAPGSTRLRIEGDGRLSVRGGDNGGPRRAAQHKS